MATAAPSTLASSVEKTNGAKLSRLLIDGGTTVLRTAFDSYHPPANLAADLNVNYPTLNKLLKKKVLRTAQWDKLFPPGGATPDSNTFDITLLFLLLTNICGLSPPHSGWHSKPPPSDTSLEANLAHIKLFRNELYGHVSTTGVDTPTFSSLWQEISAVLVFLGLDQVEIDRLKAEHCGEEDYLDVLRDWADSEEDIKSQLKDIRQCQTETQQAVEKIHKTQLEDRKTLEDSKSTLEKVHQIQIETHQAIKEACQTQLEDHKTLNEDSKSRLEEVHQSQIETHQAIKEAHQTQLEILEQLKQTAEEQREKKGDDEILKKLAKVDTERDIKYHTERYQEGTRVSFIRKVEDWLDDRSSQNRVMVISGNAGMGKSVISAVVCKRMQEAGRLSGSHFCQHDKARHRNPKVMLQSLACQLSDTLPEYKNPLVETLSRNLGVELKDMEVKDLFRLLFEEPLSKLKDPGRNIIMVIDGLDESEYQGRNELLDVIANHFIKLPCWIRFLVTTRPEINIADSLKSFKPLHLEQNDEENLQDIKLLFEKRLSHAMQSEYQEIIITKLVEKSEGLILYAYLLVDLIKENVSFITPEQLDSALPSGISSVYQTYFQRLETELCKELKIKEEQFLIFLSALAAAREPLPHGFVTEILLLGTSSLAARRKVKKGIACISTLLPVRDECIHFFHKSVKDWLTDRSCYGQHDFTVDEKEGHDILSKLCTFELDDVKRKGVANSKFNDTAKYALQHGVVHVLELEEDKRACSLEEVVKKYVIDVELVYAKLRVNNASAAEDIVRLQKQEISPLLSEESEIQLNTLLFLLRKYHNVFRNLPAAGVFFQTLLNEGGTVLSAEASKLLQGKYSEITYMEYLDKEGHEPAPQAHFLCSSPVTCFDVSPQLDYMVCECKDGTIHLWSLCTGKKEWIRTYTVKVKKRYSDEQKTWRTSPSSPVLSCYRSVVFHPTKDVVLPGILSHAYAIDGELKPLFPKSSCRFTVCSILNSGGETVILTNCLDDAKCIIMWSLQDGSEVARISRDEDVLSFACSRNGEMLAISHSSGSICLLDVKNSFITLAQASTSKVCGMIKFSPDHQFLFGWHEPPRLGGSCGFRVNVRREIRGTFLLDVLADRNVSYKPLDYESRSEAGFLAGDPLSCVFEKVMSGDFTLAEGTFLFVLNEQSVLRSFPGSSSIVMFSRNELSSFTHSFHHPRQSKAENIAFSLDGETVYVVASDRNSRIDIVNLNVSSVEHVRTLTAWDVSSGDLKAKKTVHTAGSKRIVPVKEGVLFTTGNGSPELWNFELAECVHSWSNVSGITEMIPISEEQVACVGERNEVNILDTTSGNIVATIPFIHEGYSSTILTLGRESITCNSRYQLLFPDCDSLQLSDGTDILWKTRWSNSFLCSYYIPGMFSPTEEFILISTKNPDNDQGVYVLDALSGKTLHILCRGVRFYDCKFISDEECVIDSKDVSNEYLFQLFNIKSGDLLSVIVRQFRTFSLSTCPVKHLIAIAVDNNPRCNFTLIQLKMPQCHAKRITKTP